MRKHNLLIIILLVMTVWSMPAAGAYAQDTNYVKKYGNLLSLKSFLYGYDFSFQNHSNRLKYVPDYHSGVGVGVWCKYFPFDICYRQELTLLMRDDDFHRMKTTDMQLRGYGKFFAGDIYVQKYSGFYPDVKNRFQVKPFQDNDLPYNPDLSVFQFDMVGKYIFNHERFSYKAGFTANERQLRSAGSPTVGAALYYIRIESDSLLISRERADMQSCNIGVNGGYAYNFVFGKRSTIFVSASTGINASNVFFSSEKKKGLQVSLSEHLKAAYWLNFQKWSFGGTVTYNIIHHTLDDAAKLYVHTKRAEALVIRRFWVGGKD